MPARHLESGALAEELAARHLSAKGYEILSRNWRCAYGELDIVCRLDGTLVFVEVKSRAEKGPADPKSVLTPVKMSRLGKAAALYLSENDLWSEPCRFDLISVTFGANSNQLEHTVNAFEPGNSRSRGQTLGGGDSSWQPW